MQTRLFSRNTFFAAALTAGFLGLIAGQHQADAQTATAEPVVVVGEEVPSAYGAPPAFSRNRFSNLVNSYVLPPGAVFAGLIYQGDALRFNRPDHRLTQEIEVGLPYRFGVAIENSIENFRGHTQERTFSLEARYALADWNKIPLNPTIFVEYKFGIGRILHDEGPPAPLEPGEAQAFLDERLPLPDAAEVRLLLAQDFGEKIEWAANGFFEQEVGGDRGREIGVASSIMFPICCSVTEPAVRGYSKDGRERASLSTRSNERLKIGAEMQFTSFTDAGIRNNNEDASNRLVIGPTIAWKPSKNTRLDLSPLFGVTHDAPRASVFLVFSMLFGPGGEPQQAEAPASTRNR